MKYEDTIKLAFKFVNSSYWQDFVKPLLERWIEDPLSTRKLDEYLVYQRHFAERLIKEIEGYGRAGETAAKSGN